MIPFLFFLTSGVIAQPQPPVLISPLNNATNVSLFPTFDRYDAMGLTSYRIRVFQGASVVIDQAGITTLKVEGII
ncbi:MAG TPA: hypothetical protein VIL99_04015 [Ignavibacteria bacterium]